MNFQLKVRALILNFFEKTELFIVNIAMKAKENSNLKFRDSKKTDYISKKYSKEINDYWSKYTTINNKWHKYYSSKNNICDPRYIPNDLYYTTIDQHFNNRKLGWGFSDKNYYSLIFNDIRQPKTLFRRINGLLLDENYNFISLSEATEVIDKYDEIVLKPSLETGSGKGIEFLSPVNLKQNPLYLIERAPQNYIVQEVLKQNKFLENIHPRSINTVRVISLILNNEINILSSCLRMGINESRVDNATAGGISCGLNKDGSLKDVAYSFYSGDQFLKHPQGFEFNNAKVPSYNRVIDLVIEAHKKIPHFRLVSWDISIDVEGNPVLIEANTRQGGINFHQFSNGPLFGDLTDQVLEEVFNSND